MNTEEQVDTHHFTPIVTAHTGRSQLPSVHFHVSHCLSPALDCAAIRAQRWTHSQRVLKATLTSLNSALLSSEANTTALHLTTTAPSSQPARFNTTYSSSFRVYHA